jgi:hypothetical protein
MPGRTDNIDEYSISYTPNSPPSIGLYSAGKSVGALIFKPNGEALPPVSGPGSAPPTAVLTLYYHLEDFQNIIDILRNEKPVTLYTQFTLTGPPGGLPSSLVYLGRIFTGKEPTGEGEQ